MMKRLDQRGVAALEFCLVAVPLFTLMFVIFDLGRYAITVQSLSVLANAEVRAIVMQCYAQAKSTGASPSGCTTDYLTASQKQTIAPLLYAAGLTPAVNIAANSSGGGASALTITASQPGFAMLVPIWGSALNAPSVTTSVPY